MYIRNVVIFKYTKENFNFLVIIFQKSLNLQQKNSKFLQYCKISHTKRIMFMLLKCCQYSKILKFNYALIHLYSL